MQTRIGRERYRANWVAGLGEQPSGEFDPDAVNTDSQLFACRNEARAFVRGRDWWGEGHVYVERYEADDHGGADWVVVERDIVYNDGGVDTEPVV
jgi:hypothetical protein